MLKAFIKPVTKRQTLKVDRPYDLSQALIERITKAQGFQILRQSHMFHALVEVSPERQA